VALQTKRTRVKTISFWHSLVLFLNRETMVPITFNYIHRNKIEDFLCVWQGHKRAYFATDPDSVQWLLSLHDTHVKKAEIPVTSFNKYLSNNVIFASVDDWDRHRQVYNPVFNDAAYRGHFGCFKQTVDKLLCVVSEELKDSIDVDFTPLLTSFTIDLLGKSVMDYDFGRLDGNINEYFESYRFALDFNAWRLAYIVFPWLDKLPLPYTLQMKKSLSKLDELFERVVKTHDSDKHDFISLMLDAVKQDSAQLSDTEFVSNLFILFVAGHETTSSALSWAFYELAKNPDVQAKMYQEIQTVIGDREPTFEDLDKLHYVDNVISETLRVHPPIPMLASRQALVDCHYKDKLIPKGSLLGFNIYNIHHSSDHWKDPFKFDPDRFSPENSKGRHKFSYLPFSLGPRMCLGSHFSLISQRLVLTRLVQKFEVFPPKEHTLPDEYSRRGLLIIGGRDTTWLSLKPRDQVTK